MIIGDMEIRLRADLARLQRDMDSARRTVSEATASMSRAADLAKTALAGIGSAIGVSKIIEMADQYAKFTAQLRLATQFTREYAQAYADVRRISGAAQADLAATGTLYARIANGTRELGISQQKVADITESVNMALKVSGATTQESASAVLQLSQAFGSGTLRGEEFNAVNEAAPRLMKALADGMGVPVGALKQMAADGLITSKIMADVLPEALVKLRVEASQVQTIAGSFTLLKNNLMEFVGIQANASGGVAVLTGAIAALANNLGLLAGTFMTVAAAKFGTWAGTMVADTYRWISATMAARAATIAAAEAEVASIAGKLALLTATQSMIVVAREEAIAKLASSQASIVSAETAIAAAAAAGAQSFALRTLRLATAELAVAEAGRAAMIAELALLGQQQARVSAQITAALVAQTAAQAGLTAATGAGGVAASVGARAVGFLGGPLGAIITLLGLAATAWAVWGNKAKEATVKAGESFDEVQVRIIKGLDEQIEKNEKLLKLKGAGMSTKDAEKNLKYYDQLNAATKRLMDLNARTGEFAAGKGLSNDDVFFARIKVMKDIEDLLSKQTKAESTGAAVAKQNTDERVKALKVEYANKQEKMAAELKAIEDLKGKTADYDMLVQRIRDKYAEKSPVAAQLKQEEAAYTALITSIGEKIAANKLELSGYDKMTESQKATIKLDEAIMSGKNKLSGQHIEEARAQIAVLHAQEGAIAAQKAAAEMQAKFADGATTVWDQVRALEGQIEAYGLVGTAVIDLERTKVAAKLSALELSAEETAALESQLAALDRLKQRQGKMDGLTAAKKAGEDLEKFLDPTKAQTFGEALKTAFGSAGDSMSKLVGALQVYGIKQAEIDKARKDASVKYANDAKGMAAVSMQLAEKEVQNRLSSYADMAGAAKGFFKEGSKGYKSMEAAERAYRAVETAMAIKTMLTKSGLLTAFTALFTTSKVAEVAADTTATAASVANSGVRAAADGTAAVAKTASSVPYPYNIAAVASVIALLAAAGVAISGGGSVDTTAKDRQAAAGTGSILGDSSAKSASIAKAIELAATNSNIELTHTAGMLRALLSIESNISNLGNLLVRSGSVTGNIQQDTLGAASSFVQGAGAKLTFTSILDSVTNNWFSKISGKITNAIFGGNVTALDTGIMAQKGSLGSILAGGVQASQYTDTKKDGGWFHSDKYNTQTNSLGAEANDQLTKVLANMRGGIMEAGKLLGIDGDAFSARLNSFVVDLGKISTKGLSTEQIQKQLEAVFSKAADDMARWSVGGLLQFQKQGEGAFETLVRIASNYANLDSILQSIGRTFGAVGMTSIAAREKLIDLAGGIDQLASQTASFSNNYLTEAERLGPVATYVATEMATLGLASVKTREQFKSVVLGLDLTTDAGQQQYVALMALEGAFAKVHAATVDMTKSQQQIADERADLQREYDELTMTSAQLLNKQRMALDASNRGFFDQIQGIKDLHAAQEASKTSLGDVISKMKSFGDSARTLRDGLLTGSLTTLTPEQQYAESRRQRDSTLAAAMGGDSVAQGNLAAMQTAFLTISQKVNGGDAQYSADFASVLQTSDDIMKWTAGQVDVAQASLAALNAQVIGIADLNATMLDVVRGIDQLPPILVGSPQFAPDYSTMGTTNMAPLVEEIKSLNKQVAILTENAQVNTAALIAANEKIAAKSDGVIVDGIGGAFKVRSTAYNSSVALA